MRQYALNPNMPKWSQMAAASLTFDNINQERQTAKIQKELQEDPQATVNRIFKEKSDEGSWGKWLLFGLMGAGAAAQAEGVKLGIGAKFEQVMDQDGNLGYVKFRRDGFPVEGINLATNEPLTPSELFKFAGGGSGQSDYVGGTYISNKLKDSNGNFLAGRVTTRNNKTVVEVGGKYYPFNSSWEKDTAATNIGAAARMAIVKAQERGAGKEIEIIREWNVLHPDAKVSENSEGLAQLRRIAGLGTEGLGIGGGSAAGGTTTGGTTGGANPTVEKAKDIGRTKVVEKSAEIVADQSKILTNLESYNKNLELLDKQKTNFGGFFNEGILPFEKGIGRIRGTEDYQNTKAIMQDISAIQSQAAKMLGVNPTDKDLEFVVKNAPNEDSTNEEVARYIRKYRDAAQRTLEIARKQVDTGGRYEVPIPQEGRGVNSKKEADGSITLF
jgi:hypothetical protein